MKPLDRHFSLIIIKIKIEMWKNIFLAICFILIQQIEF